MTYAKFFDEAVAAGTRAVHARLASDRGWGKSLDAVVRLVIESTLPQLLANCRVCLARGEEEHLDGCSVIARIRELEDGIRLHQERTLLPMANLLTKATTDEHLWALAQQGDTHGP